MKEYIKLRQEGDKSFKKKEYQDAIKKYQEALGYNTQYSTGYVHLAKTLLVVDKYDDAIQQCQKALSIKSDYSYAYLVEGDAHKLKAETFLSLKGFEECSEECKKSENCYKTAIKYHKDDYNTVTLRLSALKELENLLNISIASKSAAASTDEEFDEDEDTSVEETTEKKDIISFDNQKQTQEKIAKLLEALSTGNYTTFTDVLNEGMEVSTLKTLNDWNESVLGNVLSLSDKIAMTILKNKFVPQAEIIKLTPNTPEYVSIEGGLCHTMIAIEDAREFLGHFYSNADELC